MHSRLVLLLTSAVVLLGGCGGGGGGGGGGNEGVISFTLGGYSVHENGTVITTITVQRVGGTGAVSATVTLSDGTATAPSDYDPTPIVLIWLAGDTTDKSFVVPVVDDHDDEPDEIVNMALGSPTGGAVIGSLGSATLTIVDDDVAGTVQFDVSAADYTEFGTTATPISVTRTGGMDGLISVTVLSIDGTANSDPLSLIEPVDYTAVSMIVFFADQSTTPVLVPLTIAIEFLPEQNETFTLQLTNPTNGAVIGAPASATVTIIDDDPFQELPSQVGGANGFFGATIAKHGPKLAVGLPGLQPPAGRFVVMNLDEPTLIIIVSEPLTTQLGTSIAATASGGLLVGSLGRVFAYDQDLNDPFDVASPLDGFGMTLSGLEDGRFAVGAPDALVGGFGEAGAVNIYGVARSLLQTLEGKGQENFGARLLSAGSDLLVGAPGGLGSVQFFSGTPLAFAGIIHNPFPNAAAPSPSFGTAIGVGVGRIYVGAPDEDTFATNDGRVYRFGDGPVQTWLPPGIPVANGRFGANILVLSDGRVCVQQEESATTGCVHLFDADGTLITTFFPTSQAPDSGFGSAMCEFDGALVIGAPRYPSFVHSGTVFIYRLP